MCVVRVFVVVVLTPASAASRTSRGSARRARHHLTRPTAITPTRQVRTLVNDRRHWYMYIV